MAVLKTFMAINNSTLFLAKVLDRIDSLLSNDPKSQKTLSDFPNRTFIAGGAIGNIILSEKFGLDLPINDIDVFWEENQEPKDLSSLNKTEATDDYINPFSSDTERCFTVTILKAYRNGVLNHIVTPCTGGSAIKYAESILSSFDFNCVEAGIIKTETGWELVLSKAFERLLETRQVELTNVTYPFRTLIRFFKKRDELQGLYFKANEENRLFQLICVGKGQVIITKTFEKYLRYAARQSRGWFGFKKIKDNLLEVTPNLQHSKYIFFSQKERLAFGRVEGLILGAADVKLNGKSAERVRYKTLAGYPSLLRLGLKLGIRNQVKKEISRHTLQMAESVLSQYPSVVRGLLKQNDAPDLYEIAELLADMQKALVASKVGSSKSFRHQFFGFIEKEFKNTDPKNISFKDIITKIKEKNVLDSQPLNIALDLQASFPNNVSVVELRSVYALFLEGEELDHCVGGYWSKVKAGEARVFSIKTATGRTTIEIDVSNGLGRAFIAQHYAKANTLAPKENAKIALEMIKAIRKPVQPQEENFPQESAPLAVAV